MEKKRLREEQAGGGGWGRGTAELGSGHTERCLLVFQVGVLIRQLNIQVRTEERLESDEDQGKSAKALKEIRCRGFKMTPLKQFQDI